MIQERHSIKPFRGTKLGVIKLERLAYPSKEKMKIFLGEKQIFPIGFDTYGHPIISESNLAYYQAKKENTERLGESFVPIVEYEPRPLCLRRSVYDADETNSIERECFSDLKSLKDLLISRKQAVFCGKKLNNFILYNKYLLSSNGRIYSYQQIQNCEADIVKLERTVDVSRLEEVHIPNENDVCHICGKAFSIEDIKNAEVSENEKCEKVHKSCMTAYTEEIEQQMASRIIDSVYDDKPSCQILKVYDEEEKKLVNWYVYQTYQGVIAIRFKRKVIVIKWYDNFKPFNMNIFSQERVTQFERGIHAWSRDDAIRYLGMAKKA